MSNETKQILIEGTSNRYQMKKLIHERQEKKRSVIDKWQIESFEYEYNHQLEEIIEIYDEINNQHPINSSHSKKLIIQQLEKKVSGYKQQDINKKIYDPIKFIELNNLIEKIVESKLQCYYCKCHMFLLYEIVRELKQWTLDRIDNNIGHNEENVVVCCLECNLKRRKMSQEKFMFQKNLTIIKHDN